MPSPRVRSLTTLVSLALAAGACTPPHPDNPPWVTFLSNRSIAALADTSRIVRVGGLRRVWLRFEYSDPQPIPREDGTFTRMEVQEEVSCDGRQARELDMRFYDAGGQPVGSSGTGSEVRQTGWRSFDEHPLGKPLFDPLCGLLARHPGR